jgi:hypothetical protein
VKLLAKAALIIAMFYAPMAVCMWLGWSPADL